MEAESPGDLTAQQLLQLLDLNQVVRWDERDAAVALRHQLDAKLKPDLGCLPQAHPETGLEESTQLIDDSARHPAENSDSETVSFGSPQSDSDTFQGQLTSPQPQLDMLKAIKLFAKHFRDDPTSPLRGGPATVIYFAAIAAALLRHGQRISQLSDADLRQGFEWAKRQKGAEQLNELFEKASGALSL